jgi:hypothetical protein
MVCFQLRLKQQRKDWFGHPGSFLHLPDLIAFDSAVKIEKFATTK